MREDGLLFFEDSDAGCRDGYFLGKRRVKGIYQTGRRADIKERIKKGDTLLLERDYQNRYDLHAIAVYDILNRRIGYVERGGNEDIAFIMDRGLPCGALVYELDKTSVTVGMLIEIYCTADRGELISAREEYREYLRKEAIKK